MLISCLLALTQNPNSDLSGETLLRELLTSYDKASNAQFIVSQNSQNSPREVMAAGNTVWIDYKKAGVYRVRVASYWGDSGEYWLADGKTLLYFDGGSFHFYSGARTLSTSHPGLGQGGAGFTPFTLFLDGTPSYDLLVGKPGSVQRKPYGLEIKSPGFGTLNVYLSKKSGAHVVDRMLVDNREMKMAEYRLFPTFSERPDRPIDEFVVHTVTNVKFRRNLFSTSLPKGTPVQDHRK